LKEKKQGNEESRIEQKGNLVCNGVIAEASADLSGNSKPSKYSKFSLEDQAFVSITQ
jgi:hypothetical protein